MSYRLIVFDWDGTIIDSAATIAECIRDAARELEQVPDLERAGMSLALAFMTPCGSPFLTCRRSVIRPSSRVTGAISSRARTRCCCLTACRPARRAFWQIFGHRHRQEPARPRS